MTSKKLNTIEPEIEEMTDEDILVEFCLVWTDVFINEKIIPIKEELLKDPAVTILLRKWLLAREQHVYFRSHYLKEAFNEKLLLVKQTIYKDEYQAYQDSLYCIIKHYGETINE